MASTEAVSVPFFKKKRARPTTTRQRTPSPPAAAASASSSKSQVVLPSKKAGGNLLSAGTKRTSSQRRADDLDEDGIDEGTRDGPGINWTSTGGHVNKALEILQGDEAEEMLAKRAKKDDAAEEDDVPNDGLYHGQKSYKTHIKKSQEIPKSMRTGPVRSNNSTIRTVTIVDYQPDVCKDYKGAPTSVFFLPPRTPSHRRPSFQKPVSVALETRANSCTTEELVRLSSHVLHHTWGD